MAKNYSSLKDYFHILRSQAVANIPICLFWQKPKPGNQEGSAKNKLSKRTEIMTSNHTKI